MVIRYRRRSVRTLAFRFAVVGCLGAIGLVLNLFDTPARAAEPEWFDRPYPYVAVDQDVRTTLREFGANMAIAVRMDERVRGRVQGRSSSGTARQFLDTLAQELGLEWYFDGRVLHVSDVEDAQQQMLPLGGVSYSELQATLDQLGVADPRYPLRYDRNGGFVLVTGPPAYVGMVEGTIATLAQRSSAGVTVIHGRQARGANRDGG